MYERARQIVWPFKSGLFNVLTQNYKAVLVADATNVSHTFYVSQRLDLLAKMSVTICVYTVTSFSFKSPQEIFGLSIAGAKMDKEIKFNWVNYGLLESNKQPHQAHFRYVNL